MEVYLNSITGIEDAIISMYMSKRSWNREDEERIRSLCGRVLKRNGNLKKNIDSKDYEEFKNLFNRTLKIGRKHITLLRFIDFSFTVEGLHRGGQDDWDSHVKRFENRIVRSSTRLAKFENEKSSFYEGKILTTDEAAKMLNLNFPETVFKDGKYYKKTINGYVDEQFIEDKDVLRGLYMLSIPSNFIFKINLAEFPHVFVQRNKDSGANDEVKEACEAMADLIESFHSEINREYLLSVET